MACLPGQCHFANHISVKPVLHGSRASPGKAAASILFPSHPTPELLGRSQLGCVERSSLLSVGIAGEPADVVKIVENYGQWILQTPLPKLFFNAEPGSLSIGRAREFCRSLPNQQEVTVRGIHFIQEDNPDQIGSALARFVGQTRPDARSIL